ASTQTVAPPPDRGPRSQILSPLVRKLASEHGVDLGQVPGTGTGGRITKNDVLGFVASQGAAAPVTSAPAAAPAAQPVPPAPAAAPVAPPPPPAAPAPPRGRAGPPAGPARACGCTGRRAGGCTACARGGGGWRGDRSGHAHPAGDRPAHEGLARALRARGE